jgi:predicted DNA binding protein
MDERFERAPVGVLEVDPGGTVRGINETAGEFLETEPAAAANSPIESVFPDSVDAGVPRAFETPPEGDESIEEYYPGLDRWFDISIGRADDDVLLYLRDVTDRYRSKKRVDALQEDLERLTIINELISDILAELVGASTREEIAETICTRLGKTDIYDFAWVGERELGSDDIVVRAAAGETGRTLDRIETCLEEDRTVPEERVIETGTPEVVQPVGQDEAVPEAVRRAAFADGLQSLLAIPLTYGSNVYGVVGLYTSERDAFSSRERASFGTVGEMAGFAVNATRHRNLLLSDTLVELRLRITDPADPFVAAGRKHDAALSVDGVVPQGGELLCYLTVDGDSAGVVAESMDGADGTVSTRVVEDYDDSGSLEVVLGEGTPLGRLVTRGATIRSATFDATGGDVVIDLSPEENVRRLADAVTRGYDAEVAAKRERERDVVTAQEFRETLTDRLTDRQENALKTAFLADYFESPRESNAEEVAQALDITGPTLLHHLRAGQRKLLDEFFDLTDDQAGPR